MKDTTFMAFITIFIISIQISIVIAGLNHFLNIIK